MENDTPRRMPNVPPFVKFVCANVPMVFDDSLSYYEALCALWKYVQGMTDVINNNATLEEEFIDKFNVLSGKFDDLKLWVETYFDNLDVQEEINNKLDAMVEDGTLTEIISAYLTQAGVLAYLTLADLADASNVAVGSKVSTFGYKRMGDGVYDLYVIRESAVDDVVDGYNIVSLPNTDNLVAERQQSGKQLVINLKSTDSIQDYLDLPVEKTIVLPYNTTITHSSSLFINSDTTIDLNSSNLQYTGSTEVSALAYRGDDTFTKYNGYKNITIKNGKLTGGCLLFMHNQEVTIEGIEFNEPNSRHYMQIASCYNFTVKNCIFNGTQPSNTVGSECINIDPNCYGAQPWLAADSPMIDHYPNRCITIEGNIFNNPSDSVNYRYTNAIGSHSSDVDGTYICIGLVIRNNDFGSPYASMINICDYKDVVIEGNIGNFDTDNMDTSSYFIREVYVVEDMIVSNNTITDCTSVIYTDSQLGARNNVTITNNVFTTQDTNDLASIEIKHATNWTISNNIFNVQGSCLRSNWYNNTNLGNGVKFINNEIYKSGSLTAHILRVYNTENCTVADNKVKHVGVTAGTAQFIALAGSTTGLIVYHNYTDYPMNFAANNTINSGFSDNNGMFAIGTAAAYNESSGSGTLAVNITNFSKLYLQLGHSTNMQYAYLMPFISDGRKFTSADKTWRLPVVKEDGTYGEIELSVSNSGGSYSWSGDVSVRQIYGID